MFDDCKYYDYIDDLDRKNPKVKFQLGLKIASMNVRGLVHYHSQRLALYIWMVKNDVDIMLIQEWYLHHKFGETRFGVTLFNGYRLIDNERNTKTLILCKNQLVIDDFSHLNCDEDGIDVTWITVKTKNLTLGIGSFYHRPGQDADKIKYSNLAHHLNIIKQKSKDKKIHYFIGGDFNGKNVNWGSTTTDDRGRYIIDWIIDKRMDFINDGTFTYMNSTTKKEDVLDLSLISMDLIKSVTNWCVKKVIYYILKEKNKNKNKKNDNNFLQHQRHNNKIKISDHYAMLTELHFDPICRDIPINLTWNFDTNKINDFKNLLSQYMQEWRVSYELHYHDSNYIDTLTELFQLLFFKAAYNVFGLKKYCKNMINTISFKTKKLMEEKHKTSNKLSNLLTKIKKRYHGKIPKFLKKKKKHENNNKGKKIETSLKKQMIILQTKVI